MSCYAHREDPERFVDIFNRTVEPVVGRMPAVDAPVLRQLQGPRRGPAPLRADVPGVPRLARRRDPRRDGQPRVRRAGDHRHDRRASRTWPSAIIDVKSYYIETPADVAERVGACLQHAPAGAAVVRARLRAVARRRAGRRAQKLAQPGRGRRAGPCGSSSVGDATTLIEPVQQDDALLADIGSARPPATSGSGCGGWGRAASWSRWAGRHLLLDPYLSDSLTAKYAATDKPHVRMTARAVDPGPAGLHRRRHLEPQPHRSPRPRDAAARSAPPTRSSRLVIPEANRAFVADRLGTDPAWPRGADPRRRTDALGPFTHHRPRRGARAARARRGRAATDTSGYLVAGRAVDAVPLGRRRALRRHGRPSSSACRWPRRSTSCLLPINGRTPERRVPGNFWGDEAARFAHGGAAPAS